jgi:beta-glucosidase
VLNYLFQNDIEPRFEFGFGLSYTTFDYSTLSIKEVPSNGGEIDAAKQWDEGHASPQVEGVSTASW